MGYQTSYSLVVLKGDPYLIQDLREECEWAKDCLNEDGTTKQEGSWYDHDKDFKKFSREHPETLFELSGEGEETGDIWKTYYQGGKSQEARAKIILEPFDESKLK